MNDTWFELCLGCNEFPVPGLKYPFKKKCPTGLFRIKMDLQIVQMASVKAIEARKRAIEQELLACESELGLHAGDKTKLGTLVGGDTVLGSALDAEVIKAASRLPASDINAQNIAEIRNRLENAARYVTVAKQQVPLTFSRPDDEQYFDDLLKMKAFSDWCRDMDPALKVVNIDIQCIDYFAHTRGVGFVKFKPKVLDGYLEVPSIIFMRGGAVAMLPVLIDESNGKKYTVLTIQARVPAGIKKFPEIPAGMLDKDGDFGGVAVKELREEMGLEVTKGELIDLTPVIAKNSKIGGTYQGIYPSAGGCDEFLRFFLYCKICSLEEITAFNNKYKGEPEEGEKIKLKVIPLEELPMQAPDVKALCAYFLYKEFVKKETKRIKELEALARHKDKEDEYVRWDMAALRKIIADHPPTFIDPQKLGQRRHR